MATEVTATFNTTGDGNYNAGAEISSLIDAFTFGSNNFPSLSREYTDGTSDNQFKAYFIDQRALAGSANDDLDLAGGLTNPFGSTITFTVIKELIVAIDTPDGSKNLRVGPQGVANAWQGPFGGVAAANYLTIYHHWLMPPYPWTGYTVTAGTGDILRINNPTGSSITYAIFIAGET